MTDHITLPRAAAKRLWILISMMCRDRFLDADEVLAFTALAAAIAEPEQKPEPVAFAKNGNLFWCGDASQLRGVDIDLYLAPPQPPAKQEPATDEQVAEADESHEPSWLDYRDGWREAERFHGIGKEDK